MKNKSNYEASSIKLQQEMVELLKIIQSKPTTKTINTSSVQKPLKTNPYEGLR